LTWLEAFWDGVSCGGPRRRNKVGTPIIASLGGKVLVRVSDHRRGGNRRLTYVENATLKLIRKDGRWL